MYLQTGLGKLLKGSRELFGPGREKLFVKRNCQRKFYDRKFQRNYARKLHCGKPQRAVARMTGDGGNNSLMIAKELSSPRSLNVVREHMSRFGGLA